MCFSLSLLTNNFFHSWNHTTLKLLLKLIDHSLGLNKESIAVKVFKISIDFDDFIFSVFSLVSVSIRKIYQTLNTVFHHTSKHLEALNKYSAPGRI